MSKSELSEIIKSRAGKKFRPSNGEEGEYFMSDFCYQCELDDMDNNIICPIIGQTMAFLVDDSRYPDEWIHDENGCPVCTKFKKRDNQD